MPRKSTSVPLSGYWNALLGGDPTLLEERSGTGGVRPSGFLVRYLVGKLSLINRRLFVIKHVNIKQCKWNSLEHMQEYVPVQTTASEDCGTRAKRREMDLKDREERGSSSNDKKNKVEENISNWLFGFNVYMSVMLEKKPDLAPSMIFYSNNILKAHHMYGSKAWLEYDRDFGWAKVEDPDISRDQTEVNVCLECVNTKVLGNRPQYLDVN
ncbi:hypothetical protein NDU88_001552 [Pleurodeles waltl]|uniref:Uncharacterized protein n=1 Tax=Pleurodeles waltl TaxID=8319 RepID=A0AAV7T0G8_PLEWA|nr:hypothetical protein NDU88_001552 [Pleurodeles waltl]